MARLPTRYTDPRAVQQEREAQARSPLYWCSPHITVWAYTRMSRAEQDAVNAQCRQIEQAKRSPNTDRASQAQPK